MTTRPVWTWKPAMMPGAEARAAGLVGGRLVAVVATTGPAPRSRMALFEFELFPVEQITPWTGPHGSDLHWYALTSGVFHMNVGASKLFEYTTAILEHWRSEAGPERLSRTEAPHGEDSSERSSSYTDYEVAAFVRDIVPAGQAGLTPIPKLFEEFFEDPKPFHALRHFAEEPSEELDEELDEESDEDRDTRYVAWVWFYERTPDTGFLGSAPNFWFVRIGDTVVIEWDNRECEIDGVPVWTATHGRFVLAPSQFESELRDFCDRLLRQMSRRILDIEEGRIKPQCPVDIPSLREQHEWWAAKWRRFFEPHALELSWDEVEQALRGVAGRAGIELPGDV